MSVKVDSDVRSSLVLITVAPILFKYRFHFNLYKTEYKILVNVMS